MNRDDFDSMFDPEMVHEFRTQFTELHIKNQQQSIDDDPKNAWFLELSTALGAEGIQFSRNDEKEVIYVKLGNEGWQSTTKPEEIYIYELEEYKEIEIPPDALAAAIRAGLLSPVFKFWRKVDEDDS